MPRVLGRRNWRGEDAWELLGVVAPHRGRLQLLADVAVWLVAIYVAALLRFDFDLSKWNHTDLLTAFVVAGAAHILIGWGAGLYRQQWRFGSFEELAALFVAIVTVTASLFIVSRVGFSPRLVPNSVAVGGGLVALIGMAGVRYIWRLVIDQLRRPSADVAKRVIVFGAGEAAEQLLTTMMRNPESPMYPVAILDDDPKKHRMRIRGVSVLGNRYKMADVAVERKAERLVIAIPSATGTLYRDVSRLALAAGLEVAILPAMETILSGEGTQVDLASIRPLDVRDLLGRAPVETDIGQISDYITNRKVLITGAGGSIGSELCRQLNRIGPAELIMLDRDESSLHSVQLQLEGRALLSSRNLVVADIRDRDRLRAVFAEHQPDVVFHAAALKHLPLLEMHPCEGVKTNVYGTLHLLELAAEFGVERFVNVSTDKAADPSSVLGYTKRIAERLTAHVAETAEGIFLSVRFGNVLGSRGSVLETFRAQIAAGGPVTVVHPDVTRYFMTVEEAVELVIQAGAIGNDGEALVLDMGEPVKIEDVARQLIAGADRPIQIEYTGLRNGEKLHEILVGPGEIGVEGSHPLISHVAVPAISPDLLPGGLLAGDEQSLLLLEDACHADEPVTLWNHRGSQAS